MIVVLTTSNMYLLFRDTWYDSIGTDSERMIRNAGMTTMRLKV